MSMISLLAIWAVAAAAAYLSSRLLERLFARLVFLVAILPAVLLIGYASLFLYQAILIEPHNPKYAFAGMGFVTISIASGTWVLVVYAAHRWGLRDRHT
jgi:hypothetical protein